jgi:transketolase
MAGHKNSSANGQEISPEILAKYIRKKILKMSHDAKACHIGSALSCVEIAMAMTGNKGKLFFSKASGSATIYALMGLDAKHLKENPLLWPGGSLGHGLPIAVGYALAGNKTLVLMSDAEMNEGTTWESLMFSSQHKLSNLIIVLDKNNLQACGKTEDICNIEPLADKLRAFGCEVRKVDGHNFFRLKQALTYPPLYKDKPIFIIAETTKGKGVGFMEGKYEWHYENLTPALLKKALKELI